MSECAAFDRDLARLAGGEIAASERDAVVAALGSHAACCAECGGARDLLDLLARPPADREIAPAPDEAYWTDFDRRLSARIEREQAAARPRPWRWLAAAAALVALAVVSVWLSGRGDSPAGGKTAAVEMPQSLVAGLRGADADALAADLGDLAGWGGLAADVEPEVEMGSDPGWFPDLGALDPQARRALLRWLRQERSS